MAAPLPPKLSLRDEDILIPLFRAGWHTRAVLEGVTAHYGPRTIHVVTLPAQIEALAPQVPSWSCAPVVFHDENTFFGAGRLSKDTLARRIRALMSLYQPGWFYQQLIKLGAYRAIDGLSEWFLIWDSDLIPVDAWPAYTPDGRHTFALLQHNSQGNAQIVAAWERWIVDHLGVPALRDLEGTFVPHHMWFHGPSLEEMLARFEQDPARAWPEALLDTIATHQTFSEFWAVASWMAAKYPQHFAYHPYATAGATTERFFDDGRGRLAQTFAAWWRQQPGLGYSPGTAAPYAALEAFVRETYRVTSDSLPSSLSVEANVRHIQKAEASRHLEETRSRWLVRPADAVELGIILPGI